MTSTIGGSAISIDYGGTTVALDHCRTQIYGVEIFLFGTPGLQRFEIIRKILSKGADGILFVVDSVNVASFEEAKKLLKEVYDILPGVPIVLCANKQDIRGAKSPDEVANEVLGKNKDRISVIGTSAITGEQIEHLFRKVVDLTSDNWNSQHETHSEDSWNNLIGNAADIQSETHYA